MKGYGWLLLTVALLLLLLPLPAFSTGDTEETPTPTTPTAPTSIADSTEDSADTAVFRMLCGEDVVTLTEEDFLFRTLAMEMSPTYHEEALKAQAVAAYTYYARRRQAQGEKADPALLGADFVTPNEKFPQEYTEEKLRRRWGENYDAYAQTLSAAVAAVKGVTMTHEGKLIDACYHAISNGSTEAAATVWGADIPYLQAVASPGDRLAPNYNSESAYNTQDVRNILTGEMPDIQLGDDPAAWFGTPVLSDAGTVASQPVGDAQIAGTRIRQLFGLRSAAFSVTYAEDTFTFAVKGYGHGVGMSQYGADYLARQGYSYLEILHYYYKDVVIQ